MIQRTNVATCRNLSRKQGQCMLMPLWILYRKEWLFIRTSQIYSEITSWTAVKHLLERIFTTKAFPSTYIVFTPDKHEIMFWMKRVFDWWILVRFFVAMPIAFPTVDINGTFYLKKFDERFDVSFAFSSFGITMDFLYEMKFSFSKFDHCFNPEADGKQAPSPSPWTDCCLSKKRVYVL